MRCRAQFLLLFRKRQQKTLLWWAGGLFALPIVVSTTFLLLYFSRFRRPWMNPKPPDMAETLLDHQYLRAWNGPADPCAELGGMEAGAALHAFRHLRGGTISAGHVGVASRHRATAGGIPASIKARVRVVHRGRADRKYLRGDRKSGCSSRHRFAVGLVCWGSLSSGSRIS